MTKMMEITLILSSGLDDEAGIDDYNDRTGLMVTARAGTKVKTIIKKLNLKDDHTLAFFINGEQVSIKEKLKSNCKIVIIRPTAGG